MTSKKARMRLIAFFLLANLMMLVSAPHLDAGGMTMHDCPSCPAAMIEMSDAAGEEMHQGSSCADMSLCATVALISDALPLRDAEFFGQRHSWPDAYKGASILLALTLPPPRA